MFGHELFDMDVLQNPSGKLHADYIICKTEDFLTQTMCHHANTLSALVREDCTTIHSTPGGT